MSCKVSRLFTLYVFIENVKNISEVSYCYRMELRVPAKCKNQPTSAVSSRAAAVRFLPVRSRAPVC